MSRRDEAFVQQSINLFSRVLAILFLVVFPGIAGMMLDRKLGGHYFAAIGFGVGIMFGVLGLWVLVRRLGNPILIPGDPIDRSKLVEIRDDERNEEDKEPVD